MTSLAVAEDLQGQPHLSLLVYPTVTSLVQTKEINEYIRGLWKKDRTSFWMAISEYVVFFGTMIVLFLFDWRRLPLCSSASSATTHSNTTFASPVTTPQTATTTASTRSARPAAWTPM